VKKQSEFITRARLISHSVRPHERHDAGSEARGRGRGERAGARKAQARWWDLWSCLRF